MDWTNKEAVLRAVRKNGYDLIYASEFLKNDKDVVMQAVKSDAWALEYASETCKSDKEIVFVALKQNWASFTFASEILMNNKKFVSYAIKCGMTFFFMPYLFTENRKMIINQLQSKVFASFHKISRRLKKDRAFVLLLLVQLEGKYKVVNVIL